MQDLRAEGVDGLHLQAARRFQRPRKQPSRQGAARGRYAARPRGDLGIKRGVVECGPAPERVEHALGHVGGGRFGEGETEDFFRRHAGEQKLDHAPRQDVGLAGAGIGGDPGGDGRIGHFALQAQHVRRNDARRPGHGDLFMAHLFMAHVFMAHVFMAHPEYRLPGRRCSTIP